MSLKDLREELEGCQRCRLSSGRKNLVFGEGNPDAHIMFVGEAPGAIEDRSGRPFVGTSGRFLRKALNKVGIRPEDVWITNIVKCRPPQNRDPLSDEIDTCSPYLVRQVEKVDPYVLVGLGRFSSNFLVGLEGVSMRSLRRKDRWYSTLSKSTIIPVICCYHPAAVLYRAREGSRKYGQAFLSDLRLARDKAEKIHQEEMLFREI